MDGWEFIHWSQLSDHQNQIWEVKIRNDFFPQFHRVSISVLSQNLVPNR